MNRKTETDKLGISQAPIKTCYLLNLKDLPRFKLAINVEVKF